MKRSENKGGWWSENQIIGSLFLPKGKPCISSAAATALSTPASEAVVWQRLHEWKPCRRFSGTWNSKCGEKKNETHLEKKEHDQEGLMFQDALSFGSII